MPRPRRATPAGYCYHVLNRGNARQRVFHKDADYAAFLRLFDEAQERCAMRILAYGRSRLWQHSDWKARFAAVGDPGSQKMRPDPFSFSMPETSRTSNGMIDIIGDFKRADGSGMYKMGVRLFERPDGTFDLITVLTKQ